MPVIDTGFGFARDGGHINGTACIAASRIHQTDLSLPLSDVFGLAPIHLHGQALAASITSILPDGK